MAWHNFFLYSFAIPFPLSTVLGWKQNFFLFIVIKFFFIAVTALYDFMYVHYKSFICSVEKNNMYILVIVNVAENCSHIFINDKKFIEINLHYESYIYIHIVRRNKFETNVKKFHLFSIFSSFSLTQKYTHSLTSIL